MKLRSILLFLLLSSGVLKAQQVRLLAEVRAASIHTDSLTIYMQKDTGCRGKGEFYVGFSFVRHACPMYMVNHSL